MRWSRAGQDTERRYPQAAADREFGDGDSAEPDSHMRRGVVRTGFYPANVCVVVIISQRLAVLFGCSCWIDGGKVLFD